MEYLGAAIIEEKAVKTNIGAEKDYAISFSTLQDRMKISNISRPRLRKISVFIPEQEISIVQHLKCLDSTYSD